jgi:hypothetical protein
VKEICPSWRSRLGRYVLDAFISGAREFKLYSWPWYFQAQWQETTLAAEVAFESEVKVMREFNEEKTKLDKADLRKKKEELEAFKDVNTQEIPAAERLEIIARLEIKRWIEEVEHAGVDLDKARNDFQNIKEEVVEQKEKSANVVQV